MKKKFAILCLILIWLPPLSIFAERPCFTEASLQYAQAAYIYAYDLAYCEDAILPGPCKEEAIVKYNHALNTIATDFMLCCCENAWSCCGH